MNSRGGSEGYHVLRVNETSVKSSAAVRWSRRQEEGDTNKGQTGTQEHGDDAHMQVKVKLFTRLLNNEH